jgi:hypothetical protein
MTAPDTLPTPRTPVAAPPVKKSRQKWPWIVGGVVALLFIISIANSGNSPAPTGDVAAPALEAIPPQQGAAGSDNPTAQKAEAVFLSDLQTAGVPLTSQSTVTGYATCVILKNGTSQDSAAKQTAAVSHLTSQQATDFVTGAGRDLCPLIK